MATYRSRQQGKLIRYVVAATTLVVFVAIVLLGPVEDWWFYPLVALAFGMGILLAWQFSNLTVEVDDDEVRWWFGRGIWPKSVQRAEITSATPVHNKWWWGWGIRYYGKGWLYNVSGLEAVEIVLKSGKHIRIGTDDPQGLAAAIAA